MAMILDAFINSLSDLLVQMVREKVTTLLGVEDEIQNLQSTLEAISTVLEDAESKRMQNKAIQRWLNKLKDVMYDADDILDLCRIEAEKHSTSASSSSSSSSSYSKASALIPTSSSSEGRLSCFVLPSCFRRPAFSYKIATAIKNLNQKLEQISKEKDNYGLLHQRHNLHDEVWLTEKSDKTSSVIESDLVGADIIEDTQKLVNLLTRNDTRENVIVFAIVGMGGIGKTTRAQLVFHDEIIEGHFNVKFWVSVSTNYDENDLLRDVISSGNGDHTGAISRSQLEAKLVDIVRGKKFLLVLDDVWEDSVWDRLLRNPLSRGASGSRVLLTSRNEWVAKQMKTVYCHHVEVLPPEDGWSLLCKKLILRGQEREIMHLKDVGLEVVEKCGGLPLAIKAMGAVLCTKSRRDWELVLRSTVWSISGLPEQVNKALYLSYLHLPSHIRQCFLYCYLLPKSRSVEMTELVQLWIAEGFIEEQRESSSISLEEVGEWYYRELIWRNLLQTDQESFDLAYKMHDLLRCLAAFLVQDESSFVKAHHNSNMAELISNKNTSTNLRRLSIAGGDVQPDVLRNMKTLRTLILFNNQSKHLNAGVRNHLPPFLRVLELCGSKLEELPDSVTCLAHLRYLGLQGTHITALPETIGNLKYLQFLILYNCCKLDQLPKSIVALKNLRCLNILNTRVQGMPAGIGSLLQLCNLKGYSLHPILDEGEGVATRNKGRWSTLEDLGPLSLLRRLWMTNLERTSHSSEARAAAIMEKSHLISVTLSCTDGWIDGATQADRERTEEVFKVLQPPSCVELLQIKGFPGCKFPKWMVEPIFTNLRLLIIYGCKYCEDLPPLGHLPNLVHVYIGNLQMISNIGSEFFVGACGDLDDGGKGKLHSSTFAMFPKLQNLAFDSMPNLRRWDWDFSKSHDAMPCLHKLWLERCPKLISLPAGLSHHATSLTILILTDVDSLNSVGNIGSLKKLEITNSSGLERVLDLVALKKLVVRNCPSLDMVYNLCSIQSIEFLDFEKESLPVWLLEDEHSPKPEKLHIHCNQRLFEKICQQWGEEWPKIQHISRVEIYGQDDEARASYTKEPFSFTTTFSKTN